MKKKYEDIYDKYKQKMCDLIDENPAKIMEAKKRAVAIMKQALEEALIYASMDKLCFGHCSDMCPDFYPGNDSNGIATCTRDGRVSHVKRGDECIFIVEDMTQEHSVNGIVVGSYYNPKTSQLELSISSKMGNIDVVVGDDALKGARDAKRN